MNAPSPVHHCNAPAEVVWQRVLSMLETLGATVFCTVDHAANASKAGMELPFCRVAIFGKAEVGTPLMQTAPDIALDLPLRCMVREDAGRTVFIHLSPERLAKEYGIPDDHPSLRMMQGALRKLTAAAQGHTA
ncbi:DUF302 domain-containing protein [Nitratidesulfovibrio vulgaris]|uniref:DUF302 domain-containing protein n=2 Tax=Nitratidesulfovibrio vulgaris TaxID=881 RepID=Q72FD8_NITV2|nr:DUF302 domain-containing protein [Nitratidesulfovibrio vulgaris]GEB80181.1 hypothetical protein DDE01_15960 [Desulfovibrio desulfuricans]HBW16815.1 DUF302 domain-containing protein [Desulfovibrio sp.]AAS94759.1 conserved hypothetical protein [Nitratidesulfovibrio vulgaris str. Hildenborough]ABM29715.1 protein of unknown function DUF302 [Nitratidesulfovibrio vulgaris DP4]ADP85417.1 protein of unknown function DUF302 [Nitratidesulfovibrio vulgaris RCH1]